MRIVDLPGGSSGHRGRSPARSCLIKVDPIVKTVIEKYKI